MTWNIIETLQGVHLNLLKYSEALRPRFLRVLLGGGFANGGFLSIARIIIGIDKGCPGKVSAFSLTNQDISICIKLY